MIGAWVGLRLDFAVSPHHRINHLSAHKLTMSYGRREEGGKDTVYFLTREDIESSTAGEQESVDDQSTAGAYNPETKEINWDCPCLGMLRVFPMHHCLLNFIR